MINFLDKMLKMLLKYKINKGWHLYKWFLSIYNHLQCNAIKFITEICHYINQKDIYYCICYLNDLTKKTISNLNPILLPNCFHLFPSKLRLWRFLLQLQWIINRLRCLSPLLNRLHHRWWLIQFLMEYSFFSNR